MTSSISGREFTPHGPRETNLALHSFSIKTGNATGNRNLWLGNNLFLHLISILPSPAGPCSLVHRPFKRNARQCTLQKAVIIACLRFVNYSLVVTDYVASDLLRNGRPNVLRLFLNTCISEVTGFRYEISISRVVLNLFPNFKYRDPTQQVTSQPSFVHKFHQNELHAIRHREMNFQVSPKDCIGRRRLG